MGSTSASEDTGPPHSCGNCQGVNPETCLFNPVVLDRLEGVASTRSVGGDVVSMSVGTPVSIPRQRATESLGHRCDLPPLWTPQPWLVGRYFWQNPCEFEWLAVDTSWQCPVCRASWVVRRTPEFMVGRENACGFREWRLVRQSRPVLARLKMWLVKLL